jgi:transcriptional regulator with XRE-family HTH domain
MVTERYIRIIFNMLGRTLRKLRTSKGWTQAELAARAKVTREYLTLLESGARTNPSLAVLQRLAKALGVSVGELMGGRKP